MEEEKALIKSVGIDTSMTTKGGLIPNNLDQLWRLAVMMAKSGMMPDNIKTPEAVAVAVQMGLEVGLSPMQAVQNIAVINGRPTIWGDSVLGLVRASGLLEDFEEYFMVDSKRLEPTEVDQYLTSDKLTAVCIAKRKDQDQPIERAFSISDAKTAKLWGVNVWAKYPKRMLQMRPRSWTLRDGFGDVTKGLRVAEEVIDMVSTDGESFHAGSGAIATLNEKPKKGKGAQTGTDIYKTQDVEAPEKPTEKETGEPTAEEEAEDQTRKLYMGLTRLKFKKFLKEHTAAIPGMAQEYQNEIKAEHEKHFPGQRFPILLASDAPPPADKDKSEESLDMPIMLNCPRSYDEIPEKNEHGRVSSIFCENEDNCNPEFRLGCKSFQAYQKNIAE